MAAIMKRKLGTCLAVLTFAILYLANTALGLPCKGWVANTGDTEEVVAGKCGEAMYKEQRVVKQETTGGSDTSPTTTTVDVWAFDFGPNELMQAYHFENGRLTGIVNLGYGRLPDATDNSCRNGELLAVGDNSLEVFLKCGEPTAKEQQTNKVVKTISGGETLLTTVPVVEWTYRYGPDLPGYTLRIENGTVTEIRAREFGK